MTNTSPEAREAALEAALEIEARRILERYYPEDTLTYYGRRLSAVIDGLHRGMKLRPQTPVHQSQEHAPDVVEAAFREGYEFAQATGGRSGYLFYWQGSEALKNLSQQPPASEVEAIKAALEPVMHWYQSDEHPERPLAEIVTDVVADLQQDRAFVLNPPKHKYWYPGDPECPEELKAGNGELHTLRCKICGKDDPRESICRAGVPAHPDTTLRAENEALVEALERAREDAEMAASIPVADQSIAAEVRALGERAGYGNLMVTASALWREKLGDMVGAEFACSPCRITASITLERIDLALAAHRERQ